MNYSSLDDESLLRLLILQRENALSELYDRYARLVFSIALNTTGDHHLAEEITQDVFIRAWEKARSYDATQGRVVTWLTSITRNRSIDMLRRRRVRVESRSVAWEELTAFEPPDSQDVEGDVELNQAQQRMRWAVSQLPEEQKKALSLAYFQGLSHQEISDLLGVPLGTIKTRIRLAMQKLRQLLNPD